MRSSTCVSVVAAVGSSSYGSVPNAYTPIWRANVNTQRLAEPHSLWVCLLLVDEESCGCLRTRRGNHITYASSLVELAGNFTNDDTWFNRILNRLVFEVHEEDTLISSSPPPSEKKMAFFLVLFFTLLIISFDKGDPNIGDHRFICSFDLLHATSAMCTVGCCSNRSWQATHCSFLEQQVKSVPAEYSHVEQS